MYIKYIGNVGRLACREHAAVKWASVLQNLIRIHLFYHAYTRLQTIALAIWQFTLKIHLHRKMPPCRKHLCNDSQAIQFFRILLSRTPQLAISCGAVLFWSFNFTSILLSSSFETSFKIFHMSIVFTEKHLTKQLALLNSHPCLELRHYSVKQLVDK